MLEYLSSGRKTPPAIVRMSFGGGGGLEGFRNCKGCGVKLSGTVSDYCPSCETINDMVRAKAMAVEKWMN